MSPSIVQFHQRYLSTVRLSPEILIRRLVPVLIRYSSSYGIVEYTPQAYLQSDLNIFYTNLAREIPSGTAPTVDLIDGAIVQTTSQSFNDNGESDLDLEYAIALGKRK